MKADLMKSCFQQKINTELAALYTSSLQREQMYLNAIGGRKVKRKLTAGLVLALVLMLLTLTAVAVELMTGTQVVEQVAVPMAQVNQQENYTYEQMTDLLRTLNENGITLDENSTLMQAFRSGRGYWERDAINEICLTVFGQKEGWTIDQKHWYGEMMVEIGAWDLNIWVIPEEGDMTREEALAFAAKAVKETYGEDVPLQTNADWTIHEVFNLVWQQETNSYPSEKAEWFFSYLSNHPGKEGYDVVFSRDGTIIDVYQTPPREPFPVDHSSPLYPKEAAAIEQHGKVMYFWPYSVQLDVYGYPHAVPNKTDYALALAYAEQAIADHWGPDALHSLGDYQVGLVFRSYTDPQNSGVSEWDFLFTTDPVFISDGYRIQFKGIQDEQAGGGTLFVDLCVEHANLGNG